MKEKNNIFGLTHWIILVACLFIGVFLFLFLSYVTKGKLNYLDYLSLITTVIIAVIALLFIARKANRIKRQDKT